LVIVLKLGVVYWITQPPS